MKISQSIKARCINFKANHFELFQEGRKLQKLKDIHKGQVCVIVGNGPSLKVEDLDVLREKRIITFAFNRVYHIFEKTKWKPTYYITQDEKMLLGCKKEVNLVEAQLKFVPAEMRWYHNIHVTNAQEFHIKTHDVNDYPNFSEDISKCIYNSKTVVYTAIQIAVYMGIKEIYLIGVDHHFHTSINDKGELIIDPTAKDYFCEGYNVDKEQLYVPNTDKSTLTYLAAKDYADLHDVKIYNATRGGKLEVFPRVDFDEIFG